MKVLLVISVVVALASAASIFLDNMEFHAWKMEFGKSYKSVEESQRKISWLENQKLGLEHNMLADQGLRRYRLGMTNFADMNNQEYKAVVFKDCLGSFDRTIKHEAATFFKQEDRAALPQTVDWRNKGYV